MFSIKRTNSEDQDFKSLVILLDADLAIRDGDEHAFFAQFNKIDNLKNVVVCTVDSMPVGCGAFKKYDADTAEIKRMFVQPDFRGKGIASLVLKELEDWATALAYTRLILETGKKQPEAIHLYKKSGYTIIANYGQYNGTESSICFQKLI